MVYKHTEPENILGETHLCAKLKHFIKLKCQVIFFFVVASLKNWEKIKVSLTELNKKKKREKTCTRTNWPWGNESYILSMLSMREIIWVIKKWSLTLSEIPIHEAITNSLIVS